MIAAYWLIVILVGIALALVLGEVISDIIKVDKEKGPY